MANQPGSRISHIWPPLLALAGAGAAGAGVILNEIGLAMVGAAIFGHAVTVMYERDRSRR